MESGNAQPSLKLKLNLGKRKNEGENNDENNSNSTNHSNINNNNNNSDNSKKERKSKKEKKEKRDKRREQVVASEPIDLEDEEDAAYVPKHAKVSIAMKETSEGERGDMKSFRKMHLKEEHQSKPLWVCPDGHIFLETFSPVYKQAYDFLVAIAEPECRSYLMHEYQLTPYSLYAAVSVGLSTEDVIDVLNRLSKVKIPSNIESFIRDCTLSYGKVKLVLQKNRYFVESVYPEILQSLLRDKVIAAARLKNTVTEGNIDPSTGLTVSKLSAAAAQISGISGATANPIDPILQQDDLSAKLALEDEDDEKPEAKHIEVHSFEIDPNQVEAVKKRCIELDYPTLEEYDFRNDSVNPNLDIDLKPITKIRPYQEKSLSKMFGNGRARSGIIVLACGAGKTLVGITAACTVKKSCLVLCTSGVSVEQWRSQFLTWSEIGQDEIVRFTSDQKDLFQTKSGIVVSTYTMIAYGGKRSSDAQKVMESLQNREWGLVILDEVHVVPAHMFRKVLTVTKAHCKLGLTATLVREDDRISDLNFLIGPKLYEANWIDLQRNGHIATVQCIEVWCPMAPEFFMEYLGQNTTAPKKSLLCIMNPNKFRYCEFLIKYHERRGDKIIVFSDNIFALEHYAVAMQKPFIYGPTSNVERVRILEQFRYNPAVKTIFISKVGDTSIDIPEANVIIQVSSHFGSRRQEAQRLGRISRPKPNARTEDQNNAFFYSLISKDTQEMFFSAKRQQFLIDQGYSFKVLSELPIQDENLMYKDKKDQLDLLSKVLMAEESAGNDEVIAGDEDDLRHNEAARRSTGSGRNLSGASGASYSEKGGGARLGTIFNPAPQRNALFKNRTKK